MAYNISYIFKAVDKLSAPAKEIANSIGFIGEKAKSVSQKIDGLSTKIGTFSRKAQGMSRRASRYIAAPLIAAAGFSLKAAGDIEKMEINFQGLLGSADKAKKLSEALQGMASVSPVNLDQLSKAARQLISFGVPAEKIQNKLSQLSDIASGAQRPLTEVMATYGRILGNGKAMATDLSYLSTKGIPVIEQLKKMSGLSAKEILKMGSASQISAKVIDVAFQKMTEKGGVFYKKNKLAATTFSGAMTILKNNIYLAAASFGKQIILAGDLKNKVLSLAKVFSDFGKSVAEFSKNNPELMKFILWTTMAVIGIIAIGSAIRSLAFAAMFGVKGIAMLFSPIGLLVATIIGLIALGVHLYNTYEPFRIVVDKIGQGIKYTFIFLANQAIGVWNAFWFVLSKIANIFGQIGSWIGPAMDKLGIAVANGFGANINANLNNNQNINTSNDSRVTITQNVNDPGKVIKNTSVKSTGFVDMSLGTNLVGV